MTATITAPRYSAKYARGAVHIAGLTEKIRSGNLDTLNYSRSACPVLSKSVRWCTAAPSDDLQAVIDWATRNGRTICKKCHATALAELAA